MTLYNLDPTIPVINMEDFFNPEKHKTFVDELAHAFRTVGFVAVRNPGVDIAKLDAAYKAATDFFNLDLEAKKKVYNPELSGQRGYVLSEIAKGCTEKDAKEFYHIGRQNNLWPEGMNDFSAAMDALFQALEMNMLPIQESISEALDQPKDFIANMTSNGHNLLRVLHYPANAPENTIWAAAHTDIDLFTILPRSTAQGLQVKNAAGAWVDVIVPDDAFIINAGDMLQNLSNGEFKSSMHRVINKDPSQERYSMVLFIHPRSEVDLTPLPNHIIKVGKQLYPAARQQDLLAERLVDLGLASENMQRELYESGLVERMRSLGIASDKVLATLAKFKPEAAKPRCRM